MKKIREDGLTPFEIQPLNEDVLGSLTVEELEVRLELQLLHLGESQWCLTDSPCPGECQVVCYCNGYNECYPNDYCSADATLCAADGGCLKDIYYGPDVL